ncbi:aspartate/glutamate racemase family protein [Acidihalobacter ferrooxydans]|uniref:Asp/Glu/hydantoin racemase n=1 Tax=Acidihalobacter ferrooxydans TaxID=1765967 RepID=A0A1P8UIT5_9GAMM|nr:aspartate/glutamate racemase family protein [Acidihalobacter ferrooxydans]APZ43742.1 Asp/Glu/hydantoin racemase [Acidihalobacter ferrooxydans]
MEKRTLLGMLTPSSNTVLEPYSSAIISSLVPEVSVHFQRFNVMEISLSEAALKQFDERPLLEAAHLLSNAQMDVIAWNGTSAGWLGFDTDVSLCDAIHEKTGAAATTSVLALNEVLEKTQVKKLGLVTPYLDDIQEAIIKNYESIGIQVVSEVHLNDRGNFSFSEYSEETIEQMVRKVAENRPDAITIFCTNMRGAPLAERLENELGIPIYDTVSTTIWKSLRLAGVDPKRVTGWGSLFSVV